MYKKTMAFFVIATFSICSLSAQNQNDTASRTAPKTDSVPVNTKTTTDTTKASAFVMNRENLRSLNAQIKDTVPTTDSTMKTDSTKSMAFVMNRENLRNLNAQMNDTVPSTDSTMKTDSTKAMAFVMNRENLRSLNAQMNDTVPSTDSTMKTDSTKSMAFVMNHQNVKSISENNSEMPDQLVVYANVSKKLNKFSISDK